MNKHEKSAVFEFIIITIIFMRVDNVAYKTRDERSLEDFSGFWHTNDDKEVSLLDIGKIADKNEKGELELNVYHIIPAYMVSDTVINFRSKNIKFQVIIGNDIVYSFMPETQPVLLKGNGSCFHRIHLSREAAGEEVCFKIFPTYNDKGSLIDNIYLGRTWDYFGMVLDENFFGFQFSIMTALIGLLLILISFGFKMSRGHNERNRVLGILTLSVGTWAASETLLPQLLFGHSSQLNEINHLLLIFMPYFFISYIYQDLEHSEDIFLRISFGITVAELLLITGLTITGIQDSHEAIYIVHVCFGIITVLALTAVYKNISYCKKNKIKYNILTKILSLGVFVICAIWDIGSYYLNYAGRNSGSIMRLGILVGVLVLVVDSTGKLFDGVKKAELTDKIAEVTYTDVLTGLGNRTAFENKEKEIQKMLETGEINEILVCQFDINDLRKVNGNYGHAYGDRHIIKCAEIINEAFGKSGSAFRVGGDEFTVFLLGDGTEYVYEKGILRLQKLEREYNRTPDLLVPLHIAYGHAVYDKEEFETLEKAEMEADKRMYEFKDRMKKGAIV